MQQNNTRPRRQSLSATAVKLQISSPLNNPALRAPVWDNGALGNLPPTPTLQKEHIEHLAAQVRPATAQDYSTTYERSHIRKSSSDSANVALRDMLGHGRFSHTPYIQPTITSTSASHSGLQVQPDFAFHQPDFDDFQLDPQPKSSWEEDDASDHGSTKSKSSRKKKLKKERGEGKDKARSKGAGKMEPVPAIPTAFASLALPEINHDRFSMTSVLAAGAQSLLKFEEEQQQKAATEEENKVSLLRVLNDEDYRSQHTKSPSPRTRPISPAASFSTYRSPLSSGPSSPLPSHPASSHRLDLPFSNQDTASPKMEEALPKRSRRRSFGRLFTSKKHSPALTEKVEKESSSASSRKRTTSAPTKYSKASPPPNVPPPPVPAHLSGFVPQDVETRYGRSTSSPQPRTHLALPASASEPNLSFDNRIHPGLHRPRGASDTRPGPTSQHSEHSVSPVRSIRPMRSLDSNGPRDHYNHSRSALSKSPLPQILAVDTPSETSEDPFARAAIQYVAPAVPERAKDSLDVPLMSGPSSLGRSNSVASLIDPMVNLRSSPVPALPRLPASSQSRAPLTVPYVSPYGSTRKREETNSSLTSGDESETTTSDSHVGWQGAQEPAIYDYTSKIPLSPTYLVGPDSPPSPSFSFDSRSRTMASDLRRQHSNESRGYKAHQ